ncbi:MAG: hypothetical protein N3E42_07090, partial [Candidatus Bipolaricaulota bacterium]|nr:hypothetical protein [Candidatus Bipolaricaulota bacterium]
MSNKIYKIIVENFSTGQENLLYKDNNIYKINNFISNKYIVHSYNLLQYILNTQNPNIVINNSNNWFFDSNNSLIKSNDISNNQNTFLQFTLKKEFFNNIIDYSELNLKINFKVSSELNYDNFFIYINNQIINIESGEVTKTIDYNFTDVNNDLEIKFKYEKDSSVSVGEDGVTILDIKLNVLKEQQFQIYPKEIIKLNNEPINATGVQDLLLLIDDNINQKINTTSKYKLYFKLKYYSLYLIEETNINFVTKTTEEKKLFNITGSTLDYITYLTPWIMDINNLQALKITNSDKNIKMQIEDIYLIIGTENIEEKITDSIEEYINILESGNGSGNGSGSNGSETGKNTVEYAININKIIGNPYFNDKWKKQFY